MNKIKYAENHTKSLKIQRIDHPHQKKDEF